MKLGEVSEWLMVPLSKSGLRLCGAWVRIPPSPPKGSKKGMNNKKKCFVIMPFSETDSAAEEKWTKIFEHIIKPAVEDSGVGYECKRYSLGRANIIKDILEDLNRAQVVIADLTDSNPNVLWELGVRHTLKRRTILISQDRKFLPSDLKDYPIIVYDQTKIGFDVFKDEIKNKLEDIEANPDKPDSPVADFLQFKNIDILAHEKAANLRKLDALISESSFNINEVGNVAKQLAGGLPPSSKLQNTCIKLILSTQYINLTEKVLNDVSLCDRMVDWFNQQVDFAHQSLIMDLDQIPKQLAVAIQSIKDKCISLLGSIAEVRIDFASDNYQEPKEPVIILSSPEHEEFLKLEE